MSFLMVPILRLGPSQEALVGQAPTPALVVAGAGDAAYVEKLRDRVRSEGLGSHVSFVGFVLDAEKYALLADAAVFVLPSYSENFGNVRELGG